MDNPSFDNQLNKLLLKPRFVIEHKESKNKILKKFKDAFELGSSNFRGKVVGSHIVIDVAKSDEHFWSPQLQIEIDNSEDGTSIINGLFGPKPTLWTLFMFIHFGIALAFAVFITMFYTDRSLGKNYSLSLILTISMPILWVLFYIFGRLGKKKGYAQMVGLDAFMRRILDKGNK